MVLIAEVSRLSRDSLGGRLYVQQFVDLGIPMYFRDKDGWTIDIRMKLLHWLFCRFWIWIKHVDRIYDQYVNGNWGKNPWYTEDDKWSIDIFTRLVHDGWSISKHTIEDILDLNIPLKEMYNLYNEDVSDNLYKNYGHIEYGNMTYKELTTEEEFKNVRISF